MSKHFSQSPQDIVAKMKSEGKLHYYNSDGSSKLSGGGAKFLTNKQAQAEIARLEARVTELESEAAAKDEALKRANARITQLHASNKGQTPQTSNPSGNTARSEEKKPLTGFARVAAAFAKQSK